jgi:hypothetical protein
VGHCKLEKREPKCYVEIKILPENRKDWTAAKNQSLEMMTSGDEYKVIQNLVKNTKHRKQDCPC